MRGAAPCEVEGEAGAGAGADAEATGILAVALAMTTLVVIEPVGVEEEPLPEVVLVELDKSLSVSNVAEAEEAPLDLEVVLGRTDLVDEAEDEDGRSVATG